MAETVILALGSNLGDRFEHLQAAIRSLDEFMVIHDVSSIYETPPFEMKAEQDFLNLCLRGETELEPHYLLKECKRIEAEKGRFKDPSKRGYQSRPIDIDIVFYGDLIITTDDLIIPHPELIKRNFVLTPLNEIAPDYIHPMLKKPTSALLTELADESKIERFAKQIHRNK
ncbi:MAG: 2-amino-4-hydroxy-6-hydroxymethyldihydropteridine diphosphokinase [Crocinitomicaceae bacterium]